MPQKLLRSCVRRGFCASYTVASNAVNMEDARQCQAAKPGTDDRDGSFQMIPALASRDSYGTSFHNIGLGHRTGWEAASDQTLGDLSGVICESVAGRGGTRFVG